MGVWGGGGGRGGDGGGNMAASVGGVPLKRLNQKPEAESHGQTPTPRRAHALPRPNAHHAGQHQLPRSFGSDEAGLPCAWPSVELAEPYLTGPECSFGSPAKREPSSATRWVAHWLSAHQAYRNVPTASACHSATARS